VSAVALSWMSPSASTSRTIGKTLCLCIHLCPTRVRYHLFVFLPNTSACASTPPSKGFYRILGTIHGPNYIAKHGSAESTRLVPGQGYDSRQRGEQRPPDMTTPLALTCRFRHTSFVSPAFFHKRCHVRCTASPPKLAAQHPNVARPRFNTQTLVVGEHFHSTFTLQPTVRGRPCLAPSRQGHVGPGATCSVVVYSLLPSEWPALLVRQF
jgi:hypothetical protein